MSKVCHIFSHYSILEILLQCGACIGEADGPREISTLPLYSSKSYTVLKLYTGLPSFVTKEITYGTTVQLDSTVLFFTPRKLCVLA